MFAVIFDVDGTLVDSVDLHARAWQEALAKFSKLQTFEEVRSQIGKGADQLLPVFLSPAELENFGDELTAYRNELFKRRYLPDVKPFAKTRELFQRIAADGVRRALGSSAKGEELTHYKRIAEIEDLVDIETSADDAEKTKPCPDIFQAALDKLKVHEPQHVLVVGDTPYDAQAAQKIGLRTIGFLSGGFSEASLQEAGCVHIYAGPAHLLERYDQSELSSLSLRREAKN